MHTIMYSWVIGWFQVSNIACRHTNNGHYGLEIPEAL